MGRTEAQVIALGQPTFGSVFNADDPKRSPANTLSVGNNIKLEDGNLRGFPAPALLPDAAAPSSTAPAMFYVEGIGWQYATDHVSLCHDSVCPWAPSNRRFSYRATQLSGQLVASDGNGALRRLGYSKEEMTGHGFRTMASTLLNEQGWNRDAIERQLAHAESNSVRDAYNRADYLPERRRMMQAWADYLDAQRESGKVVPLFRAVGAE